MRVTTWRTPHHARAKQAFLSVRSPAEAATRAAQIAALPSTIWRGQTLYAITCDADFGRGPHVQYVPEGLLWALLDLRHYRCPFHKG